MFNHVHVSYQAVLRSKTTQIILNGTQEGISERQIY